MSEHLERLVAMISCQLWDHFQVDTIFGNLQRPSTGRIGYFTYFNFSYFHMKPKYQTKKYQTSSSNLTNKWSLLLKENMLRNCH